MSWPRSGLLLRRKCARIPAFFWIKTSFGLVILIFVLGRSNKGSNRGLLSTLSASVGVGGKKSVVRIPIFLDASGSVLAIP